ncbi:hypothetical protein PENTCL1PPCAC_13957, partial [Pristionchus entomophagus]
MSLYFSGEVTFVTFTGIDLHDFLRLRNRLFSGITIDIFKLNVEDSKINLDFIHNFIDNFKIGRMHFVLNTASEFENANSLMAEFPTSAYAMDLLYLPETDKLLSLPALDHLMIVQDKIPAKLFLKLLVMHNTLYSGHEPIEMNAYDLKDAMKIMSADARVRTVQTAMIRSNVVSILRKYAITETTTSSGFCGE